MSPEKEDQVERMYRAGEKLRVIADAVGVRPAALYRIIHGRALPMRSPGRGRRVVVRVNVDRDAMIARRYAQGDRGTDIARDHGITRQRVLQIALAAGVPQRRPRK